MTFAKLAATPGGRSSEQSTANAGKSRQDMGLRM